ncbi:metal ABC transporter ATP-binding protein [Caldibacillus lycopersici]|uniref:Metal ABC transporter ATP-binding protein n=1 Tax=Perspicuibacillus lycopersici TaxID=1325689 RepID=A0AAE3ISP9_9BACI|nr:metal ABC transporter ATP-binding protein [Perspicuibacillus lycopersici]MCU9613895.1 metal ABC transporter ATP-binding protein [Perspicuibacillus lycopersici]
MKTNTPVIEINHLDYRYDYDFVLENIQLKVNKGDFLAIVGPNGSGKSTLLRLILGLLKKQDGQLLLFGEQIDTFTGWDKIGFVSQKANSFNTGFPATVYEVVRSGLTKKTGMFRFYPKDSKEKVLAALRSVDMEEYIDRNIGELSGGQQQRVFIARAIISNPEVLILDEPTVGVDIQRVEVFYQLLNRLNNERGMTIVIVTHDIGTITDKVSHIAFLNRSIHFYGTIEEMKRLDNEVMSFFYGHNMHLLTSNYEHGGARV